MGTNRTCQPCCRGSGSETTIYPGTAISCFTWKSRPVHNTIGRFAFSQIDDFVDIVNNNSLDGDLIDQPEDSLFCYTLNNRFFNLNMSVQQETSLNPVIGISNKTFYESKFSVTQFRVEGFSAPIYSPSVDYGYHLSSSIGGFFRESYSSSVLSKGNIFTTSGITNSSSVSWSNRNALLAEQDSLIHRVFLTNLVSTNNIKLLILVLNDQSVMWNIDRIEEFLNFGNGKKRLFIASANNNNCANSILEGIGSSIRINGTEKLHIHSEDETDYATVDGSHYLLSGINYFLTRGAKIVSGGTEVLDYGGDNIMSVEKIGNAEVVVYGGFDALCTQGVNNQPVPTEIDTSTPFPPLQNGPFGPQLIYKPYPDWEFGNWTVKGNLNNAPNPSLFPTLTYHPIAHLLLRMANYEVL